VAKKLHLLFTGNVFAHLVTRMSGVALFKSLGSIPNHGNQNRSPTGAWSHCRRRGLRKSDAQSYLKGAAKGNIIAMRFDAEELKRIDVAAKADKKTRSEWMRSTLFAAIGD
jgi:hypothetical protein